MSNSKIPAKLLAELNRQLNHELAAAHAYRALVVWCNDQNLQGFARFFAKQTAEEQEHAEKLITHLLDRGVMPEITAIAAPKQSFRSLLEVAHQAQSMESANTQGINAVFEAAQTAKDYPAQVLMHWFIQEQIEEEAWCLEMVERVEAASCAGGLSDLDRHIERYLASGDEKP
jgi:ferritin